MSENTEALGSDLSEGLGVIGSEVIVTRRTGPSWKFTKQPNGCWESRQRKHTYRLMFDAPEIKPIWIGLVLDRAIVTVEHDIGAERVIFEFGHYTFDA